MFKLVICKKDICNNLLIMFTEKCIRIPIYVQSYVNRSGTRPLVDVAKWNSWLNLLKNTYNRKNT